MQAVNTKSGKYAGEGNLKKKCTFIVRERRPGLVVLRWVLEREGDPSSAFIEFDRVVWKPQLQRVCVWIIDCSVGGKGGVRYGT